MVRFIEDIFDGWTTTGFLVWAGMTFGMIYVSWFVKIPSAIGDSEGFPLTVKLGITFILPIVLYFMIHYKEWTADSFRGIGGGKGRR